MLLKLSSIYFVIHIVVVQAKVELVCESTRSDSQQSCRCLVKGSEYLHAAIDLCELDNDYCYVLKSSGEGTASSITRFYILNLFRKIKSRTKSGSDQPNKPAVCRNSLSSQPTNCFLNKAMCCVASITTFACQDSVCEEPHLTADAYGHFSKWKIREPMTIDGSAMKEAKAVIEMTAGVCYYCDFDVIKGNMVPNLKTTIGLFCDERILGRGNPVIARPPNSQIPTIVFHISTSKSCYVFDTEEKCYIANICKDKTFSCSSKNYKFHLPVFANQSISKHTSQTVEYVFGFCAQDVDCSGNKNAMICRKQRDNHGKLQQASSIVNYTGNDQEVVIRPTGFVWRFQRYGGALEAVVVFLCDLNQPAGIKDLTMEVKEKDHKLPLMLTLKHRCFCPDPPTECAGGSKPVTPRPQYQTTTASPPKHDSDWFVGIIVSCVVVVIVVLVCFAKYYNRINTPPPSTNVSPEQSANVLPREPSTTGSPPPSTNVSPEQSANDSPPSSSQATSSRPSTPGSISVLSWFSALSTLSVQSLFSRSRPGRVSNHEVSETEMNRTVTSDCSPIREQEEPVENTPLLPKKHSTI